MKRSRVLKKKKRTQVQTGKSAYYSNPRVTNHDFLRDQRGCYYTGPQESIRKQGSTKYIPKGGCVFERPYKFFPTPILRYLSPGKGDRYDGSLGIVLYSLTRGYHRKATIPIEPTKFNKITRPPPSQSLAHLGYSHIPPCYTGPEETETNTSVFTISMAHFIVREYTHLNTRSILRQS